MPSTITVTPWPDPLLDTVGFDPRSRYVETFWLPTLGPSAVLLLRHLADRFDRNPASIHLVVAETSHALGLGQRDGSSSPLVRTLTRLTQFDLACQDPYSDTIAVRRNLPTINPRHLRRLPVDVQATHAGWSEPPSGGDALEEGRRRSRRVAFTLLEQGDDADHVERVLHDLGFHPALCHESTRWAYERHHAAWQHATAATHPSPAA